MTPLHPLHPHVIRSVLLALATALPLQAVAQAAPERIAVYDSRAVAYAWFWSETGTRQRNDLVAAVRSAKAAGDDVRLKQAETVLREYDGRSHLAVFSTGPADEALGALRDRIPKILTEAGAAQLVSKWDAATLAALGGRERVDVTSALVAEFNLPPEKRRVIDGILAHDPIPLERARALWSAGRL